VDGDNNSKNYARATMAVNIFVDPEDPRRICKRTAFAGSTRDDDDGHRFTYDDRPGFQDNYSVNPDSADYDPAKYNRCLAYLHDNGVSLDVPLAEVRSRALRDRWPMLSLKTRRTILRKLLHT